jgi:NitT/TauT family transport system permease protein
VRSTLRKLLVAVAAAVATLALWEIGVRLAGLPEYLLPGPGAVFEKLVSTFPVQLDHLSATAATTFSGLLLAVVSGVLLALLVVYVKPLETILVPAFAAFNGIPKIAIAPLLVTWFGLGSLPKVLLAFLLGFFPVFVNGLTGLSEIEPDVLDMARLAGGTELRIFRKVRVMNALPYLTDALKVAFPLALVGSIVGEFVGGNRGIGYLILSAQASLDTPLVFASLVIITLFTSVGIGAVVLIEELFLGWRPSRRRGA